MADACSIAPATERLASDIIGYLDCQAQVLGAGGFQALAAPGSSVSLALTALLTIFIALIGYRLLFGEAPGARGLVLAAVKVGAVLAFATNWAAYQPIFYDLVLQAPAQLADEVAGGAGIATASIATRIDMIDRSLASLAVMGVGTVDSTSSFSPQVAAPPWFLGFDLFALGLTRTLFLGSTVGGFALVRIGAGLLLALGPFFVIFALFDGTRWLFAGWIRGLVATALGALAMTVTLAIELALLEPWLTDLVSRRAGGDLITGSPAALLAITAVFGVTLLAMILLAGFVAAGLPLTMPSLTATKQDSTGGRTTQSTALEAGSLGDRVETRSRALAVADAVASAQRRERGNAGASAAPSIAAFANAGTAASGKASLQTPPGTAVSRRTSLRVSRSGRARDRSL